jgi:hypothetical protein
MNLSSVPTQKLLTQYRTNFSSSVSLLNSTSFSLLIEPSSSWLIGLKFITLPMLSEKIQSVGSMTPNADRTLILNFFEAFTFIIASLSANLIPRSFDSSEFINSETHFHVCSKCFCYMFVGSFTE